MGWIVEFVQHAGIAVGSLGTWAGIGVALLLASSATLVGHVVIAAGIAPQAHGRAVDRLGIRLGTGTLIAICCVAAVMSGGRSAFTPVAVGFVALIIVGTVRHLRGRTVERPTGRDGLTGSEPQPTRRAWLIAAAAIAILIVLAAIVYASTSAPRPGADLPIDFLDTAYYSVLGRDLARTGVESPFSPAGIALVGTPVQAWYHWGELWLAAAAIRVFGLTPIDARYLVALPILLTGTALLTGTFVRAVLRTSSRAAYVVGVLACLFLAPIPVLADPYFASWASGLLFAISSYGLAALCVTLVAVQLAQLRGSSPSQPVSAFVGLTIAAILPAHIVIAALCAVAGAAALAVLAARAGSLAAIVRWARPWRWIALYAGVATAATFAWGVATSHGLGGTSPSQGIAPFNESWWLTLVAVTAGAGVLLALPIATVVVWRRHPARAAMYLGGCAVLGFGALAWGWRLADYNTFHVFFGALAVIATPLAACAMWDVWTSIRRAERRRLAIVVVAVAAIQAELTVGFTVAHLQRFGPFDVPPIPAAMVQAIASLPPDAKIAYDCPPEEQSPWLPRLLTVDARLDRRIIALCFEPDLVRVLIGGDSDTSVASPAFQFAPQRDLFPTAADRPSADDVVGFMRANDIEYVFSDPHRPNRLVPGMVLVLSEEGFALERLP